MSNRSVANLENFKCAQINGMYPDALSEQNIAIGKMVHLNVPILTDASTDSIVATYKGQTVALQSQGNTYTGSSNLETSEPVEIGIERRKTVRAIRFAIKSVPTLGGFTEFGQGHEGTVGPATLDNVLNPFSAVPDLDTRSHRPFKGVSSGWLWKHCDGGLIDHQITKPFKGMSPLMPILRWTLKMAYRGDSGIIKFTVFDLNHVSTEDVKEYRKFIRQMKFELGNNPLGLNTIRMTLERIVQIAVVCNQGCRLENS